MPYLTNYPQFACPNGHGRLTIRSGERVIGFSEVALYRVTYECTQCNHRRVEQFRVFKDGRVVEA
jgi:hypothetical protein